MSAGALHWTEADLRRFERLVLRLPGRLILPDGRELSACWPWLGARSRGANRSRLWYGSFRVGERTVRAHRFSCEALGGKGPLPPGHDREHLCVFSLCVNYEHIEYVLKEENHRRKVERRRISVHTPQKDFTLL